MIWLTLNNEPLNLQMYNLPLRSKTTIRVQNLNSGNKSKNQYYTYNTIILYNTLHSSLNILLLLVLSDRVWMAYVQFTVTVKTVKYTYNIQYANLNFSNKSKKIAIKVKKTTYHFTLATYYICKFKIFLLLCSTSVKLFLINNILFFLFLLCL